MALTAEQEAALIADAAANKVALEKLTADLAAKDKAITDLSAKQNLSSQETAILALKAKYPDVPEATLRAFPEAVREAQATELQAHLGKLKSAPSAFKTGPEAWANTGGIGPSVEAEDAAALAVREQARDKAVQSGDFMNVLRVKSRDTLDFVRKNFATR